MRVNNRGFFCLSSKAFSNNILTITALSKKIPAILYN